MVPEATGATGQIKVPLFQISDFANRQPAVRQQGIAGIGTGVAVKKIGAAHPDFTSLFVTRKPVCRTHFDFNTRIGNADRILRAVFARKGNETGFGGTVKFAHPGKRGHFGQVGAQADVQFRAANQNQPEFGQPAAPGLKQQTHLRRCRIKDTDAVHAKGRALPVRAQIVKQMQFAPQMHRFKRAIKR